MDKVVSDEKLQNVTEGKAVLNVAELIAIIPEVAGDARVQQLLAASVITKRLIYGNFSVKSLHSVD